MKAKRKVRALPPSVCVRTRDELEKKLVENMATPLMEMTRAEWKKLRDRIRARAKRP